MIFIDKFENFDALKATKELSGKVCKTLGIALLFPICCHASLIAEL